MDTGDRKIGLALSGGGVRAAVFHLGILKRMAEQDMLERVTLISTVSGASLAVGLVFSVNNNTWPTSREYLYTVLPAIREILTQKDLQLRAVLRLVLKPWHIRHRANVLAETIHKCWRVQGKVKDLPREPKWVINATTYETGKNWRFTSERMGDYVCGYVKKPDIPVAVAMASSAGFPILIGPYALKTGGFQWNRKPRFEKFHLWDGGVYENLGVEALFKQDRLQGGINYLIVSDASGTVASQKRSHFFTHNNLARLINIAVDQVRSVRTRQIMNFFVNNPGMGLYLMMGNTARDITKRSKIPPEEEQKYIDSCMNADDVAAVENYKTTLRKLSPGNFDLILRHGYEVMQCTYACYKGSDSCDCSDSSPFSS